MANSHAWDMNIVLQDRGDAPKLVGFVSGLNRADHTHFLDNSQWRDPDA